MWQRPFFLLFGLHLNLGAKSWAEIELLNLTKLCKNILPPWNLLNQQKINAYELEYFYTKPIIRSSIDFTCNL